MWPEARSRCRPLTRGAGDAPERHRDLARALTNGLGSPHTESSIVATADDLNEHEGLIAAALACVEAEALERAARVADAEMALAEREGRSADATPDDEWVDVRSKSDAVTTHAHIGHACYDIARQIRALASEPEAKPSVEARTEIAALRAELAQVKASFRASENLRGAGMAREARGVARFNEIRAERDALREALLNVVGSPFEFDDARIGYVTLQVDRGDLVHARHLLERASRPPTEEKPVAGERHEGD